MQTFSEAKALLTDMYTCYRLQSMRTHTTILPKYISSIKAGVIEQLNAQVGIYSQKLGGVIIAYNNVKLLDSRGHILDDQPYLHFDVQTDYIIFQPTPGSILKGCVNHVGRGHVGCLVHGCFNASVPQPPDSGDTWPGYSLVIGQEFLFEVDKTFTQNGILSMKGKLIDSSILPMITPGGKKRKRQSVDVNAASKRQRKSSTSQCNDTSGDVNANNEHSETMAPPSVKKKKKHKHVKDSDFSSDSGIDFLPSPEGVVDACHLKRGKHKKSKARHNNDSSVVEDECFVDNDESVKEESMGNSHEQSVVSGLNSSDQDTIADLTQASQSVPRKKKHKKLKKLKTEPE